MTTASEELLECHEAEALPLRRRYEVHRELFDGIGRWRENWTLFRELGGKAADPSWLHNRGGNLLREQKQRADLQKSLPKLEKSLKARIDLWEGGHPFLAYVPGQWAAFHEEKERAKQERQIKKTKQLKEEAKFGATALWMPPKHRWLATTPTGAAKVQKLGGLSTPLSTALSAVLGATVCHSARKARVWAWVSARLPAAAPRRRTRWRSARRTPCPPRTLCASPAAASSPRRTSTTRSTR